MVLRSQAHRPGATAVELAFILPVFLLLVFGLAIGGLGIFRYNQISSLAREGARYASVRGLDYNRETGKPAATQTSIYQEAILPNAHALDTTSLSCEVSWDQSNAPTRPTSTGKAVRNYVIVTVTYNWVPENSVFGAITMTSKSVMPMTH